MAELLRVEGLSVDYRLEALTIHAVRGVSFALNEGQKLGLVGESGSGKTTIANALMGMIRPPGRVMAGRAVIDGTDLLALSPAAMRRHRLSVVSYVPQGAMNSLNPVQTVRTSLLEGFADHGIRLSRSAQDETLEVLLRQVGLDPGVARRYPHELSGGMKQRVCIAIAIALKPRLLIADEPTSALDVVTQRQIMETLDAVRSAMGSSLILIGHDMGLMAQFVDELMVMREGRMEERGTVRAVFGAPRADYTRRLIASIPVIGMPRRTAPAEPAAARAGEPLLDARGVGKTYGAGFFARKVEALAPLSFTLDGGRPRIVSVVGQSGSGKTTLGSLILGFEPPSTGAIAFRGRSIAEAARRDPDFRRGVQAIPQDPYSAFNPFYTVDHAFVVPLMRLGLARTRREAYDLMGEAVRRVGLDPKAVHGRHAHQLSGGQRQRLMVARAISLRPQVIVADEPVSMVDASLRAEILGSIVELRDRMRISVLYITHDLATAYAFSDYVLVMQQGRVVEAGTAPEVIGDPRHPYTRLLVDSIPWPDPDRRWADGKALAGDVAAARAAAGAARPTLVRSRIEGFALH